jgi:hypothetical protein
MRCRWVAVWLKDMRNQSANDPVVRTLKPQEKTKEVCHETWDIWLMCLYDTLHEPVTSSYRICAEKRSSLQQEELRLKYVHHLKQILHACFSIKISTAKHTFT